MYFIWKYTIISMKSMAEEIEEYPQKKKVLKIHKEVRLGKKSHKIIQTENWKESSGWSYSIILFESQCYPHDLLLESESEKNYQLII